MKHEYRAKDANNAKKEWRFLTGNANPLTLCSHFPRSSLIYSIFP